MDLQMIHIVFATWDHMNTQLSRYHCPYHILSHQYNYIMDLSLLHLSIDLIPKSHLIRVQVLVY